MQTTVFQRLVTWLIGTDLSGCGKIRSLTQKLVQVLLQTSRPPGTPPLSFCSQHKQTKKHDNILFPNLFLTKHLAFILEAPHFSLFPPNKFSLMENDQHKYSREVPQKAGCQEKTTRLESTVNEAEFYNVRMLLRVFTYTALNIYMLR